MKKLIASFLLVFALNGCAPTEETPTIVVSTTESGGNVLAGFTAPLIDFNETDYAEALASDKLIVLYFYANWCPLCIEETKDALYPAFNEITREDVVGFQVSFNDNETDQAEKDLAQEFGVAYQHTKVFILNGERILKSPETWNLDRYLSEIETALNSN